MKAATLFILLSAGLASWLVFYAIGKKVRWYSMGKKVRWFGRRKRGESTLMSETASLAQQADDISTEFRVPATSARPPFRLPLGYFTSAKLKGRRGDLLLGERDLPVLVIGAIKSGKTSGYVVPGILEWGPGPVISTSVKADVLVATIVQRLAIAKKHGGRVVVFDPSGLLNGDSSIIETPEGPLDLRGLVAPWTPLSQIRSWEDAAKSADLMVFSYAGGSRGGSDNAQFFNQQAGAVLAGLLFHYSQTPGATMRDVVKAVADFQRDATSEKSDLPTGARKRTVSDQVIFDLAEARQFAADVIEAIRTDSALDESERQRRLSQALSREADFEQAEDRLRIVKDLMRTAPATFGSIVATLDGLLSVYRNRHELGWQKHDDPRTIDPLALVSSASTLYIVAPANEQKRYSALISALVGRTLESARLFASTQPAERLPADLLASLDELTNTAPLQDLESYISTARAHAICFELAVQSWSQLVERYGEDSANTILSNSGTLVVLPRTKDRKTLEYMSLLLGEQQLETVSFTKTTSWSEGADGDRKSKSKQGGTSETKAQEWRPVATPERIASMLDREALMKIGGHSAQALQRRAHEEPGLIALASGKTTQVSNERSIANPAALNGLGAENFGLAETFTEPATFSDHGGVEPSASTFTDNSTLIPDQDTKDRLTALLAAQPEDVPRVEESAPNPATASRSKEVVEEYMRKERAKEEARKSAEDEQEDGFGTRPKRRS